MRGRPPKPALLQGQLAIEEQARLAPTAIYSSTRAIEHRGPLFER
jgi:hypothetical protein